MDSSRTQFIHITNSIHSKCWVYCTQLMTNTWVSHIVNGRMFFNVAVLGMLLQGHTETRGLVN